MLRPREFATSFLLHAAWFEAAHFGGLKPIQMVAQCIGNRVRLGWGDWHQVLSSLPQYSAELASLRQEHWLKFQLPAQNDPRFLALLPLMDQVYDNSGERLVGEAVLWADARRIESAWFRGATHPVTGQFKRCGGSAELILFG